MKIWRSDEKNDDKIIAFISQMIYKANPPINEIDDYLFDLKTQNPPTKQFFGIPLRYVSEINLQEGKKYIEVVFRGDREHLKIGNERLRNEIFDYFKHNIPGATYSNVKESKKDSVMKPVIAMGVIIIAFLSSLYIAVGMKEGEKYEVKGYDYHGLDNIFLALGSLGIENLGLIFGALFLVASLSFIKKYKNPTVKDTLLIRR
jgi:hypothetical protein